MNTLLQVYIGAYRRPGQVQRDVIREQSRDDIECGMLVAIVSGQYVERPLLAKVKEIMEDDKILVTWLDGRWTTSWKVLNKREGRSNVEWTEVIEKNDVVLFDFELTSGGKLRLSTIRELKRVYDIE
ncbi:hypothetical protein QZH41_020454 [Actinostola sp. cb2023]|nr:hypothetical protein QZH41_020454 [Actinostola sp. cb2023]